MSILDAFRRALEVARRISECSREMNAMLDGLSGTYLAPGPSGSLTRGKVDVLPTGRNFYGVDPTVIPTRAAWEMGVRSAEHLLKHYMERHGRYPETVGQWLMSMDGYKADGEQISQVLYLLGTRPVWSESGAVRGVEVIPLEELGRPRIDVLIRLSGIARDTLPNYVYLIDEAVEKVVGLREAEEDNYVRKHYMENLRRLREMGIENEDIARCRVFSAPPGTYSAGVNYAVEASAWKERGDLAEVWVAWNGYAYTRKVFGERAHAALMLNLKTVDVVARNHQSDEHDLLNCCCYFGNHGGFYNAVREVRGEDVEAVVVDTTDASALEVRTVAEEVERVVRAKLLNPAWVEAMKAHGYRGASEFAHKILHLYGWSATADAVEDWIFNEIAANYILNEEMRRWFEEHNVWAAEEIARRLVEAAERGLWNADEEMLHALREAYGEIEGILEDALVGDVQGGEIRIMTHEDVERWADAMKEVKDIWKRAREG